MEDNHGQMAINYSIYSSQKPWLKSNLSMKSQIQGSLLGLLENSLQQISYWDGHHGSTRIPEHVANLPFVIQRSSSLVKRIQKYSKPFVRATLQYSGFKAQKYCYYY